MKQFIKDEGTVIFGSVKEIERLYKTLYRRCREGKGDLLPTFLKHPIFVEGREYAIFIQKDDYFRVIRGDDAKRWLQDPEQYSIQENAPFLPTINDYVYREKKETETYLIHDTIIVLGGHNEIEHIYDAIKAMARFGKVNLYPRVPIAVHTFEKGKEYALYVYKGEFGVTSGLDARTWIKYPEVYLRNYDNIDMYLTYGR